MCFVLGALQCSWTLVASACDDSLLLVPRQGWGSALRRKQAQQDLPSEARFYKRRVHVSILLWKLAQRDGVSVLWKNGLSLM